MDGIIVDLESLMGTDDALSNILSNKKKFSKSYIVEGVGLTGPPTVSYYFCVTL